MDEIWKYIQGFEGKYQVSNLGRIRNLNYNKTKKEKVFNGIINKRGYCQIGLWTNGIGKIFLIHRLVAFYFILNPKNKPYINHIDGNKSNNRVDNLEWCTQSENEKHAHRIGLKNFKGENSPYSKLTQLQVDEIREKYSTGNYFQRELGKEYGVNKSHISRIIRFKEWQGK